MKKTKLINKPTRLEDLDFNNFDIDISPNWEHRAEALQVRKRRAALKV